MTYAELILPEFDHETASTRTVLACVPDGKHAWRAHPKMNTIGWAANHLVEIVGWTEGTLTMPSWDVSPPGGEPYKSPTIATQTELLATFDQNVAASRRAIQTVSEATLGDPWSLLAGGQPIFTMPRAAVVRTFILNHLIHHRAFLVAYLKMNDIEVPGMYGPGG
jgi:uncharacterized damage-inducible protein DinB